jgi:hypothetical protein
MNFEIIYVNSLNQVDTGPILNGFTIYRITSTSDGTTYLINSNLLSTSISFLIVGDVEWWWFLNGNVGWKWGSYTTYSIIYIIA